MKKRILALVSLALGLVLIVGSLIAPAAAAGTTPGNGPVTVSATVNLLGELTLSTTTVAFGNVDPGTDPVANAATNAKTNAETATVKANSTSWNLTQQITSNFTGIALQWEPNGAGPYTNMGVSSADGVASGGITDGSTTSYGLDYGLVVPWTVAPTTTNATVSYTLSY